MSGKEDSAFEAKGPDAPGTRITRRVTRGVAGFLAGMVAGVVVTLALVVFLALAQDRYLHGLGDFLGWISLPVVLLPAAGVWAAVWPGFQRFWTALAGNTLGLAGGAVVGAVVGSIFPDVPSAAWAGGILGAAAGMILGTVAGAFHGPQDPEQARGPGAGAAAALVAAMVLTLLLGGSISTESPPDPPSDPASEPDPSEVESLVVFLGDPGSSPDFRYPVLERAKEVVDGWSSSLGRDTSVTVLILGDIVYPRGLRPPEDPSREQDSLVIASQIDIVSGDRAAERGARAIFLPGNHDWGLQRDWEGAVRLHRLQEFLTRWKNEKGVSLEIAPRPGTGGPEVVDVGSHLRLVLLDTAWWLLEGEEELKEAVLQGVRNAFLTADGREIVVAAHHPFASGGPHGEAPDFQRTVGIGFLLTRAGALLQDLSSPPYEDLRERLTGIFLAVRPPALFAGGHEHSVQLFRGTEAGHPRTGLVVGSASKVSRVTNAQGMDLGLPAPGFAKLFVLHDGSLELFIETTDPRYVSCPRAGSPGGPDTEERTCMQRALDSFSTVWGGRIDGE